MKLKVTHIITQMELGGAQQNTLYTLAHLDRERFVPSLISGTGGMLDEEARRGDWTVHEAPALVRPVRPWLDAAALLALYRLLRREKPHVVHTHSSKAGILGRIAAYLAGVPVIVHTFHGFGFTPGQPAWLRRWFVQLERFCALLSTHLVFVSEDNRAEAEALAIGPAKPRSLIRSGITIPAAVPTAPVRKDLGIPEDAWVVVSVGNFKPQKNPLDLVKTAALVAQQDREIHFLLVGDGERRGAVERAIAAAGISEQAHLLGWRRDIPELLGASDAFLLTSLWEGLPRALVEAAAARKPAVAYAVNGVKDILRDDETGFLIPPGDIARAAEKILWLKANPDAARRMGEEARRRVETEFDIDAMVRLQEALYLQLYDQVPLKEHYELLWNS